MKLPSLLLFLLINLFVVIHSSSFHRIQLTRQSNNKNGISLKKLGNRLKLLELRTNRVSTLATEIEFLKHIGTSYFTKISIGSPPQLFRVCFNTFTTDTFVPSTKCSDVACTKHRRYNSSQSTTYKEDGRYVDMTGFQTGFLARDDFCIGDLCAKNQGFVEMTKEFFIFENDPFDGCIGIGLSGQSPQDVSPFFQSLIDQGKLSSPIIGLWLNKTSSDSMGGELAIGGVDPERFFAPINWVPAIQKTGWSFEIEILSNNIPVSCPNGCSAFINHNLPLSVGPTTVIDTFLKDVTKLDNYGDLALYYLDDCSDEKIGELPVVSFIIGGQKYEIKGAEYVLPKEEGNRCQIAFIGADQEVQGRWIVGGSFTSKYYTAYDFEKKHVGFATATN